MTAKERVLASRLILKIENNSDYAKRIGLAYSLAATGKQNPNISANQQKTQ